MFVCDAKSLSLYGIKNKRDTIIIHTEHSQLKNYALVHMK